MACCLALGRLEKARELFDEYPEREYSAVWAWAYVLEKFLLGDLGGAAAALDDARKQNRAVEAYMRGHRDIPREMPSTCTIGSREEAIVCADIMKCAWDAHPEAIDWLVRQKKKPR